MFEIDERGRIVVAAAPAGDARSVAEAACDALGRLLGTRLEVGSVQVDSKPTPTVLVEVQEPTGSPGSNGKPSRGSGHALSEPTAVIAAVVQAVCGDDANVVAPGVLRLRDRGLVLAATMVDTDRTPRPRNDPERQRLEALADALPVGGRFSVETDGGWYHAIDFGAVRLAVRARDADAAAVIDEWLDGIAAARQGTHDAAS